VNLLILVVDDEPDVEALFRQQFRRELRASLRASSTSEFSHSLDPNQTFRIQERPPKSRVNCDISECLGRAVEGALN
jgi:CheY-like chemotaxis protein